ncbi:serine hydrolase domain-containing protein [Clostridium algidicarnis]|uniref:serine hydrolase domain-containing protein n=1 Tax=Clostridium algidicarnis TaxID=37659 RepID=UPI0016245D22|nr:serine hydrolase domain-containing protein [Clostridium algidicarnis]MBB6697409.1 beta-lactamase family protein [Clostridium algidicarnis]
MGKIDELLADYMQDEDLKPGISLALIKDRKCIYKKSHGFANLENEIEINSKTAFYLASLSKSFTAAAIMLLNEKRKLDLSDRIRKYFIDLPDYCEDIKIINLVNHTSGLKDYFNSYFENNRNINQITNKHVYNFILKEKSLNFPVGDKFQYSNTGYVLLSLLIEKVSGQSFSDFLKENFFIPLGMKNTYVFTEDKPIISNRAYGYQRIGDKYCCYDYYVLTTGDGGIYSCIDDLQLWIQAFDNESIFRNTTIEKIFSREKLNDDTACIYAFGWFTLEKDDKKVVFHAGQLGGFTNIMIKLPEDKFSIIILTNYFRDSFQKIFKDVHDCVTETNIEYGNNDNMNKNRGK